MEVNKYYQYRLVVKSSDDSVVMQDKTFYTGYDNEATGDGSTNGYSSSYSSQGAQVIGQYASASVSSYDIVAGQGAGFYNNWGTLPNAAPTTTLPKNAIVLSGDNLAGLQVEVKYSLQAVAPATGTVPATEVLTVLPAVYDLGLNNGVAPVAPAVYTPDYQVIYYVLPAGITDTNYTQKSSTSIKFVHSNGSFSGSTSW